jgi:hypothetical protein
MTQGQPVEVLKLLYSQEGGTKPENYRWVKGYTYIHRRGEAHLVRCETGIFKGLGFLYKEVRPI